MGLFAGNECINRFWGAGIMNWAMDGLFLMHVSRKFNVDMLFYSRLMAYVPESIPYTSKRNIKQTLFMIYPSANASPGIQACNASPKYCRLSSFFSSQCVSIDIIHHPKMLLYRIVRWPKCIIIKQHPRLDA